MRQPEVGSLPRHLGGTRPPRNPDPNSAKARLEPSGKENVSRFALLAGWPFDQGTLVGGHVRDIALVLFPLRPAVERSQRNAPPHRPDHHPALPLGEAWIRRSHRPPAPRGRGLLGTTRLGLRPRPGLAGPPGHRLRPRPYTGRRDEASTEVDLRVAGVGRRAPNERRTPASSPPADPCPYRACPAWSHPT
jgi:hypothetical protein